MIFLLSDGKPTDGYWQTIHSEFEKLNRDVESVVFSFAIGSRSPFDDLEKISLRSGGVARKLEDSTDISVKLSNFYLEIAVPIIWNLQERFLNFKPKAVDRQIHVPKDPRTTQRLSGIK